MSTSEITHPPTGSQLKNQLERASKWVEKQREVSESLTKTWIEFVPGWKKMLVAYKKDSSKSNPFSKPDPGRIPSI
jgi:hypothetical protein